MKLKTYERVVNRKSDAKLARREGKIPAAIYRKGQDSETISVDAGDFDAVLRNVKKGCLSTTKITLVDANGKERKVIVKDIQYHVTTYNVVHLDFEELIDDVQIKVNIPIEFTGAVDCVGVKLGGVIRQVIRHLRVKCRAKDMPETFSLDIRKLELNDSKRLKDIEIPSTVKPLADLNEVAVVIAKR